MSDPVLSIDRVSKTYLVKQGLFGRKLPLHALQDIVFSLRKGEVAGLVGESGCGKSTLARILLGLLKPSSGTVSLSGQPISDVPPRERANLIQPIFQDPYASLNPRKTVTQIVGIPLALQGISNDQRIRRVSEMLDLVGLPQRAANAFPSQMSGGQRQRVAIARALISRPKIVVCDEPTSALDVSVQSQILNLLQDLREEMNLTYLLISHDLSVVKHMSDRVVVMYLGRIVEEAETQALFERPKHPYTQSLLETVLLTEPGKGLPDLSIRGDFPNPIHPPSGCAFHPRCRLASEDCKSGRPELTPSRGHRAACILAETN